MSWNITSERNINAEALLSQALLRSHVVIEIKQDKNLILRSCGIDTI